MNGIGPPRNAQAPLAKGRREKLIDVQGSYHGFGFVQSGFIRGRSRDHSVEQMLLEIQILRSLQAPFGKIFWLFEQRIQKLRDQLEMEANG